MNMQCTPAAHSPNSLGTIVIGSTSSDPHVVPLYLLKLCLEERGWQVLNLRCFNSAEQFVRMAEADRDTRAIVISNNNGAACEDLADLPQVLEESGCKVPVLLGGRAWITFTPEIGEDLRRLGISRHCATFEALLAELDAITAGAPREASCCILA
jgi:methylmalonyl-CoA mutase cobalamin-binding subunit